MTLCVPFDQFVPTIRRLIGSDAHAYLKPHGTLTLITAAAPEQNLLVLCRHREGLAKTREDLKLQKVESFDGSWIDGSPLPQEEEQAAVPHIGAIAYKTDDETPGVWVDAFAEPPTEVMVLRAMYDEFSETGEVGDVSFEEFVRLSSANVVVVSPEQIAGFLKQKDPFSSGL